MFATCGRAVLFGPGDAGAADQLDRQAASSGGVRIRTRAAFSMAARLSAELRYAEFASVAGVPS